MTSCVVVALYSYTYESGDGKEISFDTGEEFVLLNKTNTDWWHVQRDGDKPIYVPASYMKEIRDDVDTNCFGEVSPGFQRSHSYNSQEECDREAQDNSQDILCGPEITVCDDEDKLDNCFEQTSPRSKSLSSPSGVRALVSSLETVGDLPLSLSFILQTGVLT